MERNRKMIEYTHGMLENIITPQPVETYEYLNGERQKRVWDNNIFCFDIETSSAWYTPNHKLINFHKEYGSDFYKKCVPFSLCYIWQFGINDLVVYGRSLEDFYTLLQELRSLVKGAQIWVHNLAYEFQFLLNDLEFDKIFARSPHKVIYADWNDIRFRCSYFLTKLSLESWGIQHGKIQKKVGDIEYNILRTPLTNLTEKEYGYCENDILVMYYGLLEYKEKYKNIHRIPLTQTGEVRRVIKNLFKDDMDYHNKMTELLPRNAVEYDFMKKAFQGGYTHANYTKVGKVLHDVHSYDITSSYPAVMCSEKFPMSKWFFVRPYEIEKYLNNDYSLIVDVTYRDIVQISDITYISISKLVGHNEMFKKNGKWCHTINGYVIESDNGRLRFGKEVRTICTNVDLKIIDMFYDYKSVKYNYIIASKNDYLDERLIGFTLDMYNKKTTLKNVEGKEDLYLQSKQFLNSIYGMMVTDIVQENVLFDGIYWSTELMDIDQELEKLRCKPYKNFLAYQHGIFITAYARYNLMKVVSKIGNDVIYCDTDSIKYQGDYDKYFIKYNKKIESKLLKCLEHYNLERDLICPLAPNGEQQHLGWYSAERDYKSFITQGAKRYVYSYGEHYTKDEPEYDITTGDEIFHCTVSGVNKRHGGKAIKKLEDFKENFTFESEYCKRIILTYMADNPPMLWNENQYDEYLSTERYGVNNQPSTYCLSYGKEFLQLLTDYIMGNI